MVAAGGKWMMLLQEFQVWKHLFDMFGNIYWVNTCSGNTMVTVDFAAKTHMKVIDEFLL